MFVDAYDKGERADSGINELVEQGLEAKVALESQSGELFYRVQVVGIESEAKGNAIVAQLKDSDFRNARPRKTVNQTPHIFGIGKLSSIIWVFSGSSPTPSDTHDTNKNVLITAQCWRRPVSPTRPMTDNKGSAIMKAAIIVMDQPR